MVFNSIKIENKIPVNYEELVLNYSDNQVILLYGENGVGKTELSRTLNLFKNQENNHDQIEFLSPDNKSVELPEDYELYIYNEDFVTGKIFFDNDENLDAIIINDSIQDIEDDIKEEKENNKKITNKFDELENSYDETEKDFNSKKESLLQKLKGNDSWASRDKNIRNPSNKHNTSVNENTLSIFKEFISSSEDEYEKVKDNEDIEKEQYTFNKASELKEKASHFQKSLEKAANEDHLAHVTFNYKYQNFQLVKINNILSETIDKKQIKESADDLSKKITIMYQNNGIDSIKDSKNTLNDQLSENKFFCPTCFQDIETEYLEVLNSKISDLISEEAENDKVKQFRSRIDQLKLKDVSNETLNYDQNINQYFENELREIISTIELLSDEITIINKALDEKKDMLYSEKNTHNDNISGHIKSITEKIKDLNTKIDSHNKEISDYDEIVQDAIKNNNEYTYYVFYEDFNDYFLLKEELEDITNKRNPTNKDSDYNKLKNELNESKERLISLEASKGKINIAVEIINSKLDWITLNKDHIKIVPEDNKYYVYVNENKTNLSRLSTGQRNMISLCYFFAQINEGKEYNKYYSENGMFLILDDPISSFDYSNRTGIMSLLRDELGKILLSSNNSKVLITSHDTSVIFDSQKIIEDIEQERKDKELHHLGKIQYNTKQLFNTSEEPIKDYEVSKDYLELLTNIYYFADGKYDDDQNNFASYSIGNNIRKILEAYSTFNFNKGIRYLVSHSEILDKLPDKSLKDYYENYMWKLLLDTESHQDQKNQIITGLIAMPSYTYENKKKIARDALYFLYSIDELHVAHNIKNYDQKTEDTIKNWKPINTNNVATN